MKFFILALLIFLSACTQISNKPDIKNEKSGVKLVMPIEKNTLSEVSIGESYTNILDSGANRVSNINKACAAINGYVLESGSEFSFNLVVGKRSQNAGYRNAPVIIEGEREDSPGGGVCQVSTTLYMAAINSSLQITERHTHSEPVPYAQKGGDATVVYGSKDLKFINNTDSPLYIYMWTGEGRVYAKIVKKI